MTTIGCNWAAGLAKHAGVVRVWSRCAERVFGYFAK